MKVEIERKVLHTALQRVQGVAERRSTMPVLSHVLLQATPDGLTFTATDLELTHQGRYPARIEKGGSLCVHARKFFEIVRELPEEEVLLEEEVSGGVQIRCGRSQFRLHALSAQEFPEISSGEGTTPLQFKEGSFGQMIRKVIYAVGDGETHHILSGVLFQILEEGKKVRLVATDGHRLALVERELERSIQSPSEPEQIILPEKALQELRRLLEEDSGILSIGWRGNQMIFCYNQITLSTRLLEGIYPDYQKVIPESLETPLRVSKHTFESVIRRVSLLSKDKTQAVVMEVQPQRVIVSSQDPDFGEAREELEVDYEGEPVTLGINARYLLDASGSMEDESLILEIHGPLKPLLIRPERGRDHLGVIMPLRIQQPV